VFSRPQNPPHRQRARNTLNAIPSLLGLGGLFVLTEAIIGVGFAVERLGLMNGARIEFTLFAFVQERATSRGEKAKQIARVTRVDR
jgi:hypothetical protein